MQESIAPILHAIDASISIPGSKSITNRALLLAALAKGESILSGVLFSDDTNACLKALEALGVKLDIDRARCEVKVQGMHGQFAAEAKLYCHDAGTVTRFLIPACAAAVGEYHFSGSPRMQERPLAPLLHVLAEQGSQFHFLEKPGHMPFVMQSNGLAGGDVFIDITQSSQFLSGLMIAAPYAKAPMRLATGTLTHKTYVAMTMRMMQEFGVATQVSSGRVIAVPKGMYHGRQYQIEPDASTASYFFAMAALSNGKIHVPHLSRQCMQGDIRFLNLLEQMGCTVKEEHGGITVQGTAQLKGLGEVDMTGFSDTFMTVAALAVFADAPTTLKGLAHTRLQESDRVAAIAEGLARLGIQTESTEDSLTIIPGVPKGAVVSSFQDHRIAMSLSLIGLKIPGVLIDGAECVAKTCPDYFSMLKSVCKL